MAWLVLAMLTTMSGAAFAHAGLVRSEPADGAVLEQAPAELALTFSETVVPLALRLIRPDGSGIELPDPAIAGNRLRIALPGGLGAGSHVLSWRVVSQDGHPVAGSVLFSIGAASAPPAAAEAADRPVQAAIWLSRVLVYLGLFFGVGGSFALAWLAADPAGGRGFVGWLLALGLCLVPLAVGLQGLDALGLPLAGLLVATPWQAGFATSYGASALLAAAALLLAAGALRAGPRPARLLSVMALAGLGLALACTGHASAAGPGWLTRSVVFLHGVGIAFWLGALVPLGAALRQGGNAGAVLLRRFSRFAPVAVLPLVAAGLFLAVVQLDSPADLLATAYGQVLTVKLGLLVLLFGLACLNRWRLTPALLGPGRSETRPMLRSIRAELVLAVLVLATVAIWRFTPPPRMLASLAAEPAQVHVHGEKAMAELVVTPGRAGTVSAAMTIMTGDFGPLDPKGVTLVLAQPEAGIEPFRREATRSADGIWRIDRFTLPVPGRWSARIDILVSDFELVKIEDTIGIRP